MHDDSHVQTMPRVRQDRIMGRMESVSRMPRIGDYRGLDDDTPEERTPSTPIWDPRLIDPITVLERAATVPLTWVHQITTDGDARGPGHHHVAITCNECGRPVRDVPYQGFITMTLLSLASDILRHRVMAHEEVLSGAARAGAGPTEAGPDWPHVGDAGHPGIRGPDRNRSDDQA